MNSIASLRTMRKQAHDAPRPSKGQTTTKRRLVRKTEPDVAWGDYPRIEPGEYMAYCKSAQQYWDPGFKRWTYLLRFDVIAPDQRSLGVIPKWLNLGSGHVPKAGRRTEYFAEWVKAHGRPPLRADRLSRKVFVNRMARVTVGDTKGVAPYSVVREILEWCTGKSAGTEVNQSHSQGRQW